MKKILLIVGVCVVHNAYASSLGYGTGIHSLMRTTCSAVSHSVSNAYKDHPYLCGAAVLGTAAIMYKVTQSKRELVLLNPSVSPEIGDSLSESLDSETFAELMSRGEQQIRLFCENSSRELEEDLRHHEEAGKKIERIRLVKTIVQQEQMLIEGGYKASLIKNRKTQKNSVLLKGNDPDGYRYPLFLSDDNEGNLFCRQLNEYLNPSTKTDGEKTLRTVVGLEDKDALDEVTLKARLDVMRSVITIWK